MRWWLRNGARVVDRDYLFGFLVAGAAFLWLPWFFGSMYYAGGGEWGPPQTIACLVSSLPGAASVITATALLVAAERSGQ